MNEKESITIDKRAEKYATEIVHTRSGDIAEINPFTYDAYKTGSIDQRKIDIDKASDYLLKRLRSFRDEILGDFDTSITHEIIKFREIMNKDD